MTEKIIVDFNDAQYQESLKDLKLNVRKLEHALDSIQQITGVRELKTLDEIEKFICTKSGFENLLASAELLNVLQPLVYLQNHLQTIEHDKIEKDNDSYKIKDSVLNDLKISLTTYLDDVYVSDYHLLSKAIVHLNKLTTPTLVNCLSRSFNGVYSVNVIALQNSRFVC